MIIIFNISLIQCYICFVFISINIFNRVNRTYLILFNLFYFYFGHWNNSNIQSRYLNKIFCLNIISDILQKSAIKYNQIQSNIYIYIYVCVYVE